MALYAPKSQGSQPQMYGVPGGMYITPQQQPRPNQHPAMFNRMGAVPPQQIPMGMGAPRQPGLMQQQQQASSLASEESRFWQLIVCGYKNESFWAVIEKLSSLDAVRGLWLCGWSPSV